MSAAANCSAWDGVRLAVTRIGPCFKVSATLPSSYATSILSCVENISLRDYLANPFAAAAAEPAGKHPGFSPTEN